MAKFSSFHISHFAQLKDQHPSRLLGLCFLPLVLSSLYLCAGPASSTSTSASFAATTTTITTTSATAPVPLTAPLPLGVNLEGVCDYARGMMFVDAMKSARNFGSADAPWDEKAPVDENGWPTSDAGTCVLTSLPHIDGVYHFSALGRCMPTAARSTATVSNINYDPSTHLTTADITVAPEQHDLFLSFKNTNHGIKNIRLIRPGYPADTKELFTKEFLAQLKPFTTLRLMDYLATNATTLRNWADRPKPTDALQSSKRGAALEYAIALANQTHKDLWVNIPDQATDDFIHQIALLLKAQLDPTLHIYLEYSNEVWNAGFPQFAHNLAAAKAEVAAGNSLLNDHGRDSNQYYWAWKRVSKRLVEISNIFRSVYGDPAINSTIRPVLASQSANPYMLRTQLEFIDQNYGPPSKLIYAVAGAPYFGLNSQTSNRTDLTTDEIFNKHLPEALQWTHSVTVQYGLLARYYNLKSTCYEGGPGIEGEPSLDAKLAANRDPRMADTLKSYLTDWYSTGGELFMYFSLSGSYTKYGAWGLTEDISQPSVKTQAIAQLVAAPLPPLNVGHAIPSALDATDFDMHVGGGVETPSDKTKPKNLAYLKENNNFDYLLNVPTPGPYTITLVAATAQDTAQIRYLFNSIPSDPITITNTHDWQTYADAPSCTVTLPAGLNVLRLEILHPGLNIRAIRIAPKPQP